VVATELCAWPCILPLHRSQCRSSCAAGSARTGGPSGPVTRLRHERMLDVVERLLGTIGSWATSESRETGRATFRVQTVRLAERLGADAACLAYRNRGARRSAVCSAKASGRARTATSAPVRRPRRRADTRGGRAVNSVASAGSGRP
jgi:hypothetical protein